jgi:hypothetical protein
VLIEETLWQTTATTTVSSGQFDVSSVALVALILGIVASALSIPLTILSIRDHYTRRPKEIMKLPAPKLRTIRSMMIQSSGSLPPDFFHGSELEKAIQVFREEIDSKGFYPQLRKITKRGRDDDLLDLFQKLYALCEQHEIARRALRPDDYSYDHIQAAFETKTIFERIIRQIDKTLEKSEGA